MNLGVPLEMHFQSSMSFGVLKAAMFFIPVWLNSQQKHFQKRPSYVRKGFTGSYVLRAQPVFGLTQKLEKSRYEKKNNMIDVNSLFVDPWKHRPRMSPKWDRRITNKRVIYISVVLLLMSQVQFHYGPSYSSPLTKNSSEKLS